MAMQRKKVLWIDDEIEYLRSHIMFLESRGYSVTPVFSGDDGLHLIREDINRFDIVLVDEQMPGKDGITVLTEIKDMTSDLPVVMVTKSEEEALMEKAIGRKIDGYLTKPVNPSQILLVCKNLLQSTELVNEEVRHGFVKSYSEIQLKLKKKLDYKEWVKLYRSLVKREFAIQDSEEESIRQGHNAQKTEANDLFANFIFSRYGDWMSGAEDKPLLSHEVLGKFIKPAIINGEKYAFVVLDSIRLDQYVMIQRRLKRHFQVSNYFYSSILPTSREFALPALLTGKLPKEIAEDHPHLWEIISNNSGNVLKELLAAGVKDAGLTKKELNFYDMSNSKVTADIISANYRETKFSAIYADFIEMFGGAGKRSQAMQEMVTSSKAFRNMTGNWFEDSRLFEIMKRLSSEEVTIVLAPSSGNILCTQGTNYYGESSNLRNRRYRFGQDITADERYGYYFDDPERIGLPSRSEEDHCVILKENYYFTDHGTYHEYNEQYTNSFERGGISMEEMILPLAILKPKVLDLDLDF
jgi:DNA-binding response OmpR family regulator